MAAIYKDPETIRLVTDLDKRGHSRDEIAARLEISRQTVRKILDPDYAEAERKRLAKVDEERAPLRRQDPAYQAYHAEAGKSEAHKARTRAANARRRGQAVQTEPATWSEAAPIARSLSERASEADRQRAEAARTRGIVSLSLDGSVAANLLLRDGSTWSTLVDRLLIEEVERRRGTPGRLR